MAHFIGVMVLLAKMAALSSGCGSPANHSDFGHLAAWEVVNEDIVDDLEMSTSAQCRVG